jgi:hypothetical protein
VISLATLMIVGLFLANQVLLLAKSSTTAGDTVLTANQLYEAGQFSQAAQAYQQLVDQGYVDSSLYYNLGNAYFKSGDFGRAVLNFRRAEQLAPRDADIEANLAMARTQVADQVEERAENRGFLETINELSQEWITLNELALFAVAVWLLFALLVIVYTSTGKGSALGAVIRNALVVTTLVLVLSVVGLGSRMYEHNSQPEAVVTASQVSVMSGPGPQYVTEFELHSGVEVELMEVRENWVRLALAGGEGELQGWVPSSMVESVTGLGS